jgi:hypothetical protein
METEEIEETVYMVEIYPEIVETDETEETEETE